MSEKEDKITMKTKKNRRVETYSLSDVEGSSLASILEDLKKRGVTDLNEVKVMMEYQGCCADHGDCYCPSAYSEVRLQWELK